MSGCPDCEGYKKELHREMKRSVVLADTLIQIYGIAKDKMWYPATFEERGEGGFKSGDAFVKADREAYTK